MSVLTISAKVCEPGVRRDVYANVSVSASTIYAVGRMDAIHPYGVPFYGYVNYPLHETVDRFTCALRGVNE